MGYRIRAVQSKNRAWKLIHCSRVGGVRKETDTPVSLYRPLGFLPSMDLEAAKRHCSAINKDAERKRHTERAQSISLALDDKELTLNIKFPAHFLSEFEAIFLRFDKDPIVWRSAKQIIIAVNKDPEDWCYFKQLFYTQFKKSAYSVSYVQKLLYWINQWGNFVSRKKKVYYEPIPNPKGIEKQRLVDKRTGTRAASPLTPEELQRHADKLDPKHYNWLYLSTWLGLRPAEIDALQDNTSYRIIYDELPVIWIYQAKLVGIEESARWKPIPLKFPEQAACVQIITGLSFKRPLNKTIRKIFGEGKKCYSGRKGFTDLMLSKGCSLEAISQWLGHSTLDRTWKSYKDKKKVLV